MNRRWVFGVLVGAVVYELAAELSFLLIPSSMQSFAPIWPASGLVLALVFLVGSPAALGCGLGTFFFLILKYWYHSPAANLAHLGIFLPDQVTAFPLAELSPLLCALRGESSNNVEAFIRNEGRPDGAFIVATGRPILAGDGSINGAVAVFRDVTDQKRAQAELQRSHDQLEIRVKERTEALVNLTQELERSNEDLQQFACLASHDLQEPLRMVSAYMSLLEKRCAGKLDPDSIEFIGYAKDGALRMRSLIVSLLEVSRVGKHCLALEASRMRDLVQTAEKNLAVAIEEKHANIICDELPALVVDRALMVQVFQNLLSNAVKFSNRDAPKVHISARAEGDSWLFSIADNGIGISRQNASRVFVPFQRFQSRTEYPGTGIGLAICKKIVERHGGRIWFESEPGQGTNFYFSIPTAVPTMRPEPITGSFVARDRQEVSEPEMKWG